MGLQARKGGSYGRSAGFLLAFVGATLLCVGQATSVIFGGNSALGWLFDKPGYTVGINIVLVGPPVLGIATLRTGMLPRWCGLALVGVVVVSILSAGAAFVVVGLLWIAPGYAIWSGKSRRGK